MAYDTELAAAVALNDVIGDSRWEGVAFAQAYLAVVSGKDHEDAARSIYEKGARTLRRSREIVGTLAERGFLRLLRRRERMGSAENPVTKLFPAYITEQRFLELLDRLKDAREGIDYREDRNTQHSLRDFTLLEKETELPINVKNAGTRFEHARSLVGLDPDDCIPIPAYKAHAALESRGTTPNLIYVISVDYDLVDILDRLLPKLFQDEEAQVWSLLNRHSGKLVRNAEDLFISRFVRRHWPDLRHAVSDSPFHVISARKAVKILQINPRRTPGIGQRAWGTAARGEVNVHISVSEETKFWEEIADRIVSNGLQDLVDAVNRKVMQEVYDPEI
jgi:hypothetical protein